MRHSGRELAILFLIFALALAACTPTANVTPTPAGGQTSVPSSPSPATPPATVPSGGALFVIEQTGGIAGFCDRLEVTAAGDLLYTASCKSVSRQGRIPEGLMTQLQTMAARLAPVNQTIEDNPGGPDNLKTVIILNGTGTTQVSPADVAGLTQIGQVLLALMRDQAQATPVPTPAVTPEPTAAAGVPEAIWIRAASYANGTVHIEGDADSTFEQNLVIRVLSEDGQDLVLEPTTIASEMGERGPFSADVPVPGAPATVGYVQVFSTSARDGGTQHLTAVDLAGGRPAVLPENVEAIVISSPTLNTSVSATVAVAGVADPTFEQTLLVQVYDTNGQVIGQAPVQISADVGQRGPFSIEVALTPTAAGPGRVTVSNASARDGSLIHLSSVEIMIAAP